MHDDYSFPKFENLDMISNYSEHYSNPSDYNNPKYFKYIHKKYKQNNYQKDEYSNTTKIYNPKINHHSVKKYNIDLDKKIQYPAIYEPYNNRKYYKKKCKKCKKLKKTKYITDFKYYQPDLPTSNIYFC